MKELFVHVGMHKTATTMLQNDVFPNLRGVLYLGRPHELRQGAITNSYIRLFEGPEDEKVLVSNESLSGPMLPFFQGRSGHGTWAAGQVKALAALGKRIPHAKPIICFRRPVGMVKSLYRHYVKAGGRMEFGDFFSLDGPSLFCVEDFTYSARLAAIEDNFEHSPFVIDFDDLIRQTDRVLEGLCQYMGIPKLETHEYTVTRANSGLKGRQLRLMRAMNTLDSGNIVSEGGGVPLTNRASVFAKVSPWNISRLVPSGTDFSLSPQVEQDIEKATDADWEHVKSRTTY